MAQRTCSVDGCDSPNDSHKMCGKHRMRMRRRGHTDLVVRSKRGACTLDGCDRPHVALGYCGPHYRRFVATGSPGELSVKAYDKSATRHISAEGYVTIKVPGHPRATKNWVREHIVVMEGVFERPLLRSEEVHHRNGNRSDNRPENLELWVVKQPKGQRPADLVAWAHEILRRYESESRWSPPSTSSTSRA